MFKKINRYWINKAYVQRRLYWTLFRFGIAETPPWKSEKPKPLDSRK